MLKREIGIFTRRNCQCPLAFDFSRPLRPLCAPSMPPPFWARLPRTLIVVVNSLFGFEFDSRARSLWNCLGPCLHDSWPVRTVSRSYSNWPIDSERMVERTCQMAVCPSRLEPNSRSNTRMVSTGNEMNERSSGLDLGGERAGLTCSPKSLFLSSMLIDPSKRHLRAIKFFSFTLSKAIRNQIKPRY